MRVPALLSVCVAVGWLSAPLAAQNASSFIGVAETDPLVLPGTPPPIQAWWQSGGPRIRPMDERVARLLAIGLERSPLMRALAARIDSGDAIVYVGMSRSLDRAGLAGCLAFAGKAGDYRYLRALLNPDLPTDMIIASLAHELHHVVEVLDHPEVTSEAGLIRLYRRIGRESRVGQRSGWETDAARRITTEVRRELRLGPLTTLARHGGWPATVDAR